MSSVTTHTHFALRYRAEGALARALEAGKKYKRLQEQLHRPRREMEAALQRLRDQQDEVLAEIEEQQAQTYEKLYKKLSPAVKEWESSDDYAVLGHSAPEVLQELHEGQKVVIELCEDHLDKGANEQIVRDVLRQRGLMIVRHGYNRITNRHPRIVYTANKGSEW